MKHYLVAGLAFGDEGKGATVDALVRHTGSDLVVRYNGGAQCAHNVVLPDGRHHTFAQFGSGTFVPGCRTFISQYVLFNPVSQIIEERAIAKMGVSDAFSRTYVDPRTVVITPFQRALNRLQEMSRGTNRHGSTGMGIGVTREMHLRFGDAMLLVEDLCLPHRTEEKLQFIRQYCWEEAKKLTVNHADSNFHREFAVFTSGTTIAWYLQEYALWLNLITESHIRRLNELTYDGYNSDIIFEGGQGILLDEDWGFQPHTTWSDTTFANAYKILDEAFDSAGRTYKIGVLRSYFTRHGAGPFPSEVLSTRPLMQEKHNVGELYTGDFRQGHFDMALALYALHAIHSVDALAINHLDIFRHPLQQAAIRFSKGYEKAFLCESDFIDVIEALMRTKVAIKGYGPTFKDRVIDKEVLCAGVSGDSTVKSLLAI